MSSLAFDTYSYGLSADNRIASVTPRWLAFARDNGAPELTEEAIVGRPLSDFISDNVTLRLYEAIYDRIRSYDLIAVLPFRCDSTTIRRDMIMRIDKQSDEILAVQCTLITSEQKRETPVLDRHAVRSTERLTICSLCLEALVEPVGWMEIEDAFITLQLLEEEKMPQVVYAVCPRCGDLERESVSLNAIYSEAFGSYRPGANR